MNDKEQGYDLATIRKLLLAAFTAEDLRRFCQDRPLFRPIVAMFGPGHGFKDMVDRVIDYCETHLLWDEFLAAVKEENPRQYARFEAKLLVATAGRPSSSTPTGQVAHADWTIGPPVRPAGDYLRQDRDGYFHFDTARAIADYNRAIALDPACAAAYFNRGLILYDQVDWEGAIADYNRAIELDPGFAAPYYQRGLARTDQGDLAGAIADFQKYLALSTDPEWREYAQQRLKELSEGD
jgi:tetratricopeptide (TPR) repeat protein